MLLSQCPLLAESRHPKWDATKIYQQSQPPARRPWSVITAMAAKELNAAAERVAARTAATPQ